MASSVATLTLLSVWQRVVRPKPVALGVSLARAAKAVASTSQSDVNLEGHRD